ncbi:hypothetical protein ACOSQ4_006441 [Xanthoceras sorbifolium]
MEDERAIEKDLPILLGKPFIVTAKTIIYVQNVKLSITVLGETIEFQFTMDELNELLELGIELEKEENNRQLEAKAKLCKSKPHRPKPNLEEMTRKEELQLLNTSSEDPITDSKWLREHLAGHADDIIIYVH